MFAVGRFLASVVRMARRLGRQERTPAPPRTPEMPCRSAKMDYSYEEYALDPDLPLNGAGLVEHFIDRLLHAHQPFSLWVFGCDVNNCFRPIDAADPASADSFPMTSWSSYKGDRFGLIRVGDNHLVAEMLGDYLIERRGSVSNTGEREPFPFMINWPDDIALAEGQVFIMFLRDGDVLWVLR